MNLDSFYASKFKLKRPINEYLKLIKLKITTSKFTNSM